MKSFIASHKNTSVIVLLVLVMALFFFFFSPQPLHNTQDQRSDMEKIHVQLGQKTITAWLADTEPLRARGLSGVSTLSGSQGMFFSFDESGIYGFWMKDMIIPIDILWLNTNLQIVHIEKGVATSTYPNIFFPKRPARFVLEVASGTVSFLGLKVGDSVATSTID